jgi:hypothetical protein
MKFINLLLTVFLLATLVASRKESDLSPHDKAEVAKLRAAHTVQCPRLECLSAPIGKLSS